MGLMESWLRQVAIGRCLRFAHPVVYAVAYVWRRLMVRTTFIAVTGSVGKTTTKECLAGVLREFAPTVCSWRNQGGPTLVPLNVLRVRPWHRYAVLELGVGGPGQMDRPARLVRPDVAIILNAHATHTKEFKGVAKHAAEKAVLLRHLKSDGVALLGAEDPRIASLASGLPQRTWLFGTTSECHYRAESVTARWPERLRFTLRAPGGRHEVRTQLVGPHWASAATAVLAGAGAAGVDLALAADAFSRIPPFDGRLQPVQAPSGAIFLRDDYGANLVSLLAAFQVMETAQAARRWLVISDITDVDMSHRPRLRYLAGWYSRVADVVVLATGDTAYARRRAIEAGFPEDRFHGFPTVRAAAEFLRQELRPGDLVLLKGRITHHLTRVYLAQFGSVACWKDYCPKTMLCDICWELGLGTKDLARANKLIPADDLIESL